jgi:hypothetical protein
MATADKDKKVYTNVHGGRTGAAQLVKPVPTNQGAPVNQGTSDAKKRFFAAVSPSEKKAKMMPQSMQGMAKQVMGQAGEAATRRISQIQSLMPQKKPELISYETNPNMDWRQAAALNQEAMRGYNAERGAVIGEMGGMGRADITGQHGMDQVNQRGANQLATTAAIGNNRMNQIAATGSENRNTLATGHQNTMDKVGQDNIYAKEKDNRAFITSAMSRGATMDETAQNAYNTPGAFDPDINGITIPLKQQKQQNPIYVQPKFDKNDALRPGTGQWAQPPGVQGASVQTPAAPIPQQKDLVIGEVYNNGQTEMMWDGEKFIPLM